jgi:hypothetical protein
MSTHQPTGSIQFLMCDSTEVLRISRDGITANPDVPVDEIASRVLELLDENIKTLVKRAVEAERNKVAQWMMARGYATGHGDTVNDLLKELEWQVKEQEREACAQVCENMSLEWQNQPNIAQAELATIMDCAKTIRARGEK